MLQGTLSKVVSKSEGQAYRELVSRRLYCTGLPLITSKNHDNEANKLNGQAVSFNMLCLSLNDTLQCFFWEGAGMALAHATKGGVWNSVSADTAQSTSGRTVSLTNAISYPVLVPS